MMKFRKFALITLLLFLFAGCSAEAKDPVETPAERSYEHPVFTSIIEKEQCILCDTNAGKQFSWNMGQDNIGIINVNTFDVFPIEINRYGDNDEQILEASGTMNMSSATLGDSSAHAMTDPDRGVAHIELTPSDNAIGNEGLESNLCQDCLDAFASHYFTDDSPLELAVIDFSTKEIRPLLSSCPWYIEGNYSVVCDFEEDGKVDLKVHYSPPRFPE